MALNIKHWNEQFISEFKKSGQTLNMAEDYGITIEKANGPGDSYWACIGVKHLTGRENMGNHNVFCDVLDNEGRRVNYEILRMWQGNQKPVTAMIDKPAYEAGTNFPIWGRTPCDVEVVESAGRKSDKARGFRINHPDEDEGNTIGHHSFYVVFMEVRRSDLRTPPIDKPKPGDIEQVKNLTLEVGDHQVDIVVVARIKTKEG